MSSAGLVGTARAVMEMSHRMVIVRAMIVIRLAMPGGGIPMLCMVMLRFRSGSACLVNTQTNNQDKNQPHGSMLFAVAVTVNNKAKKQYVCVL